METERLIRTLAENAEAVTPLRYPWLRTIAWAAAGAVALVLLVLVISPRDDLDARVRDPLFLFEQGAALLTGLTAAAAALASSIPGYRSRKIVWLPVATAWIAIVGLGALRDARLAAPGDVLLLGDWGCA